MNNNITKSIAIFWYSTFDASGLLYTALKSISLKYRLLAYVGLFAFTYGSFIGIEHIFKDQLEKSLFFDLLFDAVTYGTLLSVALIPTYETIYRENMPLIMSEKKTRQKQIKVQKLQRWRLRNINIYLRLALYIFLSVGVISFVQVFSSLAFFEAYPHPTEEQIAHFLKEYHTILGYVTTFWFMLLFFFEYRIFLLRGNK